MREVQGLGLDGLRAACAGAPPLAYQRACSPRDRVRVSIRLRLAVGVTLSVGVMGVVMVRVRVRLWDRNEHEHSAGHGLLQLKLECTVHHRGGGLVYGGIRLCLYRGVPQP